MCLSPEVDLAAGILISVVAVDAIRHNRHGRTLPLALLPGIFALHSFASMFVWLAFQGSVSDSIGKVAANFYIFVAFVLLPIYVPIVTLLVEPHGWRRHALQVFAAVGLIAGLVYLYYIVQGKASVRECTAFLDFHVAGPTWLMSAFYGAATCGAMLFSGYRPLFIWGVLNCIAIVALNERLAHALPSLWCLWAACTSFFVAWFLRDLIKLRQAGGPWPWVSHLR
jgi:hypothetical protein